MPTETITKPSAPKTDELEQLKQDALSWINEYVTCREMPKGHRVIADHCPLAGALGGLVCPVLGDWQWFKPGELITKETSGVPLPPRVVAFVRAFDRGHYPELEL